MSAAGRDEPVPLPKPDVVPHVALWSGEQSLTPEVIATRQGIGYADERPADRDDRGVLWVRREENPTVGDPEYGGVHARRQYLTMRDLLCQGCGGPADRDDQGVLWLHEDDRGKWRDWPERLITTHPPVCLPCARTAIEQCHHLLTNPWVVLRVRDSVLDGVYGQRYIPLGRQVIPADSTVVYYEDPQRAWFLAAQAVRTLRGCTILDPAVLLSS